MKKIIQVFIVCGLFVFMGETASGQIFQDGMDAHANKDYKKALEIFKLLAEKGDATAGFNIGVYYEQGIGVTQDYKEALKWYQFAQDRGYEGAIKGINNLADVMLQSGHKMKNKGNLDAAIEFYKKSLEINKNGAAKFSLKSALKQKQLDQLKASINSDCQQYNKDTSIQESCLKEYFFFGGNPIHPKIIKELQSWISDSGDQVVSINLADSQGSNRYCCIDDIDASISESLKIHARVNLEEGYFEYRFYGTSKNGILVVRTFESGGGSGIFSELLLLKTKVIFKLKYEGDKISKIKERKIYLEKLYSIPLGDREKHKIAIDSDILVIDGKRVDISTL
jgi:tetratricopeptide (TPR) repeat protein